MKKRNRRSLGLWLTRLSVLASVQPFILNSLALHEMRLCFSSAGEERIREGIRRLGKVLLLG